MKLSKLPSIKSLRTFLAVASSLNFSKAAEKLSISQGAVSKQVLALEKQLGLALFDRCVNGIELTEAGKRFLPKVTEALHIIESSSADLLQSNLTQDQLNISVTPSFASLWLVNRLESFLTDVPNIHVNIRTGDEANKFDDGDNDIVIRCLPTSLNYEQATLICREQLFLLGSSELLQQKPITNKRQLASHTFIPHLTRPELWQHFKTEQNISSNLNYHAIGYEHFYMSLSAVQSHYGLALIPDFMAAHFLEQGVVQNPLGISLQSQYGYYMSIPHYKKDSRNVVRFCLWLEQYFSKAFC